MGTAREAQEQRKADKKAEFLRTLRDTGGLVCKSVKLCGIGSTATPYEWREKDPAFGAEWDAIIDETTEAAEAELYRRAVAGNTKPVYQGCNHVGDVQEFSDTCLIFLLKARKPKVYNQVQRIAETDSDGNDKYRGATVEQLRDLAQRIAKSPDPDNEPACIELDPGALYPHTEA